MPPTPDNFFPVPEKFAALLVMDMPHTPYETTPYMTLPRVATDQGRTPGVTVMVGHVWGPRMNTPMRREKQKGEKPR